MTNWEPTKYQRILKKRIGQLEQEIARLQHQAKLDGFDTPSRERKLKVLQASLDNKRRTLATLEQGDV